MLTPISQALDFFLADANSRQPRSNGASSTQQVPITQACGYFLCETIVSTINVPPCDNSAMDGIVLDDRLLNSLAPPPSQPLSNPAERITLSARIIAGDEPKSLRSGTCARIFTGAPIPPKGAGVVMQEDCVFHEDGTVSLRDDAYPLRKGQNIRPKGQDIQQGQTLFQAGHQLRPQDIGLLASIGIAEVRVYRPLTVAIVNTGNELQMPGQPLKPGKIYNSNGFMLQSLLEKMGCEVFQTGPLADHITAIEDQLRTLTHADCIIITGGVSVGEEDHVRQAIESIGQLKHWKLAIKPGKPLAFGEINGTPIWGLPGNPVSAFVTFLAVVKPYLRRLNGCETPLPVRRVSSGFSRSKTSPRQEFLRVTLDENGVATPHDNQSSGVLTSVTHCDGLAIIPANESVEYGQPLTLMHFKDWID